MVDEKASELTLSTWRLPQLPKLIVVPEKSLGGGAMASVAQS